MSTVSIENGKLISVAEAAEIIGVTPGRVRQLIYAGELKAKPLHARSWVVNRSSAEYVAKHPAKTGRPRKKAS